MTAFVWIASVTVVALGIAILALCNAASEDETDYSGENSEKQK